MREIPLQKSHKLSVLLLFWCFCCFFLYYITYGLLGLLRKISNNTISTGFFCDKLLSVQVFPVTVISCEIFFSQLFVFVCLNNSRSFPGSFPIFLGLLGLFYVLNTYVLDFFTFCIFCTFFDFLLCFFLSFYSFLFEFSQEFCCCIFLFVCEFCFNFCS